MIFANNGNLNFDFEVAPSWNFPGNFSFGGGPFDLASNWKFPGIFPFGTRKKVQIPSKTKVHPSRSQQTKYTQAGATQKQVHPNRSKKYSHRAKKVRFLRKLTILVRMLTLFWTGPQIHEDPKENQLTIGRSTHRAIYTHMWRRVRGRARAPPHVCVDRTMGRLPDG